MHVATYLFNYSYIPYIHRKDLVAFSPNHSWWSLLGNGIGDGDGLPLFTSYTLNGLILFITCIYYL